MSVLPVGNYANMFPIILSNESFHVVRTPRSSFPDLKDLREKAKPTILYSLGDLVYGFGNSQTGLLELGFENCTITLEETPQLVSAIITDGIFSELKKHSYELDTKFRARAFDKLKPISTIMQNVWLFKGFELKPIFLKDKVDHALFFSIIIDLQYKLELNGKPASLAEVLRYSTKEKGEAVAHQVIKDIKVKMGELNPFGYRNQEASRFRLIRIMEFVSEFNDVTLYDGTHVKISNEPMRIAEGSA